MKLSHVKLAGQINHRWNQMGNLKSNKHTDQKRKLKCNFPVQIIYKETKQCMEDNTMHQINSNWK